MAYITYSEKLKDPRWQRKRLEILDRDGFICRKCMSHDKTLHVHHKFYITGRDPWEYDESELITVCHICHEIEELIIKQKKILISNIKISGHSVPKYCPFCNFRDYNSYLISHYQCTRCKYIEYYKSNN